MKPVLPTRLFPASLCLTTRIVFRTTTDVFDRSRCTGLIREGHISHALASSLMEGFLDRMVITSRCALFFLLACTLIKAAPATNSDLDLGRLIQPASPDARLVDEGYYVWCGSLVRAENGRYFLFYSRWPKQAGFAAWVVHSEVAFAVGDSPLGPFRPEGVALAPRGSNQWDGMVTHNPQVLAVGGKYYLFYTGNRGDGNSFWTHRNNQRIGVAIADQPGGPWRRLDQPIIDISDDPAAFDSQCVTNPAAALRPDGGILLVYKAVTIDGTQRGGPVRFGTAIAASPEGPYVKQPNQIFEPDSAHADAWMVAEDPFVWYSERYGHQYYAIVRDVIGSLIGEEGGLALFQSVDGLTWTPARHPKVLGKRFLNADGSLSPSKLERPQLYIDSEGFPRILLGAVSVDVPKARSDSFNVQLQLQ